MTTARTRTVVLLGHPVAHSLSPRLHTAAFAAAGVDAVYVTADVAPDAVADAVAGVAALGLLGANVTIPHKQQVARILDRWSREGRARLSDGARLAGAVNTLYRVDGQVAGDNTDITGLGRILTGDIGVQAGETLEIFGAGGVARATAVAAGRLGLRVLVTARRPPAAADVAALAVEAGGAVPDGTARVDAPVPRVVVNCTPLGMHGEALPDRYLHLRAGQVALDLVYAPTDTPFVAAARRRGAVAVDGRRLLLAQAADSFRHWTGRPAPVAAMEAALR